MIKSNKGIKKAIIVGCGRMGYRHFEALTNLGIQVIALVDVNPANAEKIASDIKIYKKPRIYSEYKIALKENNPDLVIISSHANTHTEYALITMNSNIPFLLVEKPIATSLADCNILLETEKRSNTKVAVNHQMRFTPNYKIPKKIIDSDEFGGISSMHVAAGDFGMAMNCTHIIEGFRFLADENPHIVNAWLEDQKSINPRGANFKDVSGCMRITTKSGKRLYIDASNDQGQGIQITFMTKYGRITLDELEGFITTTVRKKENRNLPENMFATPSIIKTFNIPPAETILSTQEVLKSLINGKNYPNLFDATRAVATLIAGYHSSRLDGKSIIIESLSPDNSERFQWA